MERRSKGFVSTALLLGLPAGEIWFLRHWAHQAVGPNAAAIGIHSLDVVVPAFLGALLYLDRLRTRANLEITIRGPRLALNLALLFVAWLGIALGPRFDLAPETRVSMFLLAGTAAVLTSLFCALDPLEVLHALQALGKRLWFAVLGFGLLFTYPVAVDVAWRPLSRLTAASVSGLLDLFGEPVRALTGLSIHLVHPDFATTLQLGCAGLEGTFFFLFFYCLLGTFELRRSTIKREAVWVVGGSAILFLINAVRIALFMAGAIWMSRHARASQGRDLFAWAFHANLGWALYFGAIFLIFRIRRELRRKESPAV